MEWNAICRARAEDPNYTLDSAKQKRILKMDKGQFHGYVLMGCAAMGNLGKKQQFYSTFVSHFHGLSRMGCEILSKYGYTMKRTMYDSMKAEAVRIAQEITRCVEYTQYGRT